VSAPTAAGATVGIVDIAGREYGSAVVDQTGCCTFDLAGLTPQVYLVTVTGGFGSSGAWIVVR
jgi:hypothetical protein